MRPRIEVLAEKKLVGKRLQMSLSVNRTFELWRSFMQERSKITNQVSTALYSLQVYKEPFSFESFTLHTEFEKWAAVEVPDFENLPVNMETFILPAGTYAIFLHSGGPATTTKTFDDIFNSWLPNSQYCYDHRPQFELLGEKYKNNDPDSEEEIWIPIRLKQ